MPRLCCLLMLLALSACVNWRALERGTTVPYDELHEHRADLAKLVTRELEAGHTERAFYALEAYKSSRLAALTAAARRGEAYEDLADLVAAEGGEASGDARGLKLVAGSVKRRVERDAKADNDAFWEEQKKIEDRLAALAEGSMLPYDLTLRGLFVLVSAEEMSLSTAPGQLLLSYFVSDDATWAIGVTAGGVRAVKLSLGGAAIVARVERLVDEVRDPRKTGWQKQARALYDVLLEPFASELVSTNIVTVVPDGALSNVPFALLVDKAGHPLMRSVRVGYLPSASFYRALLARPLFVQPPRMLAIGNPAFPKPWQSLPQAEAEARALEHLFGEPLLLTQADASEQRFYDAHASYNIYHFATHGMLTGTLGGKTSSLVLTPGGDRDGYLSAGEISGLDLSRSYLTVLSACETAASGESQSSLDSIAAAFLSAGSPTVIGSQWSVSDASTAQLMMLFYEKFLELGTAEALRQAQLSLQGGEYQHPYYWGAFVLYGWDR